MNGLVVMFNSFFIQLRTFISKWLRVISSPQCRFKLTSLEKSGKYSVLLPPYGLDAAPS